MDIVKTHAGLEEVQLLFGSLHSDGLLAEIMHTELNKGALQSGEVEKATEYFASIKCDGVVHLIRSLEKDGEDCACEVGSHSINLHGVAGTPRSSENFGTHVSLMIGNIKKDVTPIKWLAYLARGFNQLSPIQQKAFDAICADFAKINDLHAAGAYTTLSDVSEEEMPKLFPIDESSLQVMRQVFID